MTTERHCETCICGKRAPVQAERDRGREKAAGTISWEEHLQAWGVYAARFGNEQSAVRLAERGGFGYYELIMFLGHEPKTWTPRR